MQQRELPLAVERLYRHVTSHPSDTSAIAELAIHLAESGSNRPIDHSCADVASTGGPSSLTTLLCPLGLRALGFTVAKLGVPGRPAGGIDVLGTIRGYRTKLTPPEVDRAIAKSGYAHFAAGSHWAPADAALFALRQKEGTQAVPALAAASLLSKKLAAGVGIAALEARVAPHGNFGATVGEAKHSAETYCAVAKLLGLQAIVIMTDAATPYQPNIGRGEALSALDDVISANQGDPWLHEHAQMCRRIVDIVAARVGTSARPATPAHPATSYFALLAAHLEAQGASIGAFRNRVAAVKSQPSFVVRAAGSGFVRYDLAAIRSALSKAGNSTGTNPFPGRYPDPAGVRLLQPPWRRVQEGEPVLRLRGLEASLINAAQLYEMSAEASRRSNTILGIMAND